MEDKFRDKILKLALPITAQQFMLALVSACDAFMLGGVNQNSLSAVSLASQITFVFNLILTALTIGENMFVAQYYGKKDFGGVRTSAGLVLKYVLLVSSLFMVTTLFAPQSLMRLFTNDTILIDYGMKYLKLIGLSYVFSGALQVLQGILKNCGNVGKCTLVSIVVVCLNIVLNAIFIYGYYGFPRMEIAGAALATVIANGIGLVITIFMLYPKKELWIGIADIKCKKTNNIKKFWKHVYPVLFNEIVWGGGFTMYSVILGHLGSDAVAANSIANITKRKHYHWKPAWRRKLIRGKKKWKCFMQNCCIFGWTDRGSDSFSGTCDFTFYKSDGCSSRIFKIYAVYEQLLCNREIYKFHDNRRHLSGRGRYKIWVKV